MQVLFTIELRVACNNGNNYIRAQHAVQQAALQVYAKVAMMDGGNKPEVAIYSHDYEKGHCDVPLMELSPENDAEMASMSMRFAAALSGTSATRRLFLRVIPSFLGRAIVRDVI
jgi:hypothetical protein